jgi:SAM-dependent methyltransferase/rubredoxin
MKREFAPSSERTVVECPVCGAGKATDFFSIADVPVTCASVFATRQEALEVPTGDVHLVACDTCGFVFNRSFDPALGAVGARYESSQAASAHFGAFARSLARDWVERHDLRGRTVLEVGCGSGDFLRLLVGEGAGTGIGIDPCCAPDAAARAQNGIRLIADVFDDRYLDLKADALVCRHTIEHIKDVRRFLTLVHGWALRHPRTVLLFELPASERVFAERAFWDVYYEHCNYFTERTVRFAFEAAGFEVLRAERVYDGQYLIVEARAVAAARADAIPGTSAAQAECRAFGIEVSQAIGRCRERLRQLAHEANVRAPLVLWQGASKTVGFLSAVGDATIDGAVDLNPQRQGRFLPGSGLQVHAPAELVRLQPRHVVLMNAVYLREVRAQVQALGLRCQVHPVNDLLGETSRSPGAPGARIVA